MANVFAIDIGGSHFRLGVFDARGPRLSSDEGVTDVEGGREWMLAELERRGNALIEKSGGNVQACGISFGGPVDFERQRVNSVHVAGWKNFELADWVQHTFKIPCWLDNDANAGALGEYRFGGWGCHGSLVYVTVSTGIGSGIVLDGKLFRGKDGLAGELGHLPVSDLGMVCECGARGCLETVCSGQAIALRAQGLATRVPETVSRIIELSGGDIAEITCETVFKAADQGEEGANFIVNEAARCLAQGIMAITRILNPEYIVLGGGVAQAGESLLRPVRMALEKLSSPSIRTTTQLTLAKLGIHSPLFGAAAFGLDGLKSGAGGTNL
jgi:glucokinase